jgi:hypothetical protein
LAYYAQARYAQAWKYDKDAANPGKDGDKHSKDAGNHGRGAKKHGKDLERHDKDMDRYFRSGCVVLVILHCALHCTG